MTDFEQELVKMLREERERNNALMEILLEREGVLNEPISVPIEDTVQLHMEGKEPWYIRRRKLQRIFKKPETSDVNIREEDLMEQEDAS